MSQMKTNANYGHKLDTKQIALWVPIKTLQKWDDFVKNEGTTRTNLIKNAIREYIWKYSQNTTQIQHSKVDEKLEELKEVVVEMAKAAPEKEHAVIINDADNRDRILEILELGNMRSNKLSHLLGLDEMILVKILSDMRELGMVEIDKRGEWNVK